MPGRATRTNRDSEVDDAPAAGRDLDTAQRLQEFFSEPEHQHLIQVTPEEEVEIGDLRKQPALHPEPSEEELEARLERFRAEFSRRRPSRGTV